MQWILATKIRKVKIKKREIKVRISLVSLDSYSNKLFLRTVTSPDMEDTQSVPVPGFCSRTWLRSCRLSPDHQRSEPPSGSWTRPRAPGAHEHRPHGEKPEPETKPWLPSAPRPEPSLSSAEKLPLVSQLRGGRGRSVRACVCGDLLSVKLRSREEDQLLSPASIRIFFNNSPYIKDLKRPAAGEVFQMCKQVCTSIASERLWTEY